MRGVTGCAGRRVGVGMLLAASAALGAGCRADVGVDVDVVADGSGEVAVTVVLDEAVLEQAPDLVGSLAVDDLVDAGWEVADPRVDGGRAVLRAVKPFTGPDGADAVLDELTGPEGAFAGLRLTRESGPLTTEHRFSGEIDLTAGVEAFGGPRLREVLGGSSVALEPAELERRAGAPLAEVLRFELTADLPGEQLAGGGPWRPVLGEVTPVVAQSRIEHGGRLRWAAGSLGALLALSVVLGLRWRRRP